MQNYLSPSHFNGAPFVRPQGHNITTAGRGNQFSSCRSIQTIFSSQWATQKVPFPAAEDSITMMDDGRGRRDARRDGKKDDRILNLIKSRRRDVVH